MNLLTMTMLIGEIISKFTQEINVPYVVMRSVHFCQNDRNCTRSCSGCLKILGLISVL
jgi:hypothetical protein